MMGRIQFLEEKDCCLGKYRDVTDYSLKTRKHHLSNSFLVTSFGVIESESL